MAAVHVSAKAGDNVGLKKRQLVRDRRRRCWLSAWFWSVGSGGSMWPAWLAMTMPDPPGAMTRPNSSRTWATPTRSTAMMACGDAWAGDSPAVWTRWATPPMLAAVAARALTDSWEATSTCAVLGLEAGGLQTVFGGQGEVLVQVGQQDCLADPDPTDDGLADGACADEDDDLGRFGCTHPQTPFLQDIHSGSGWSAAAHRFEGLQNGQADEHAAP